MKEKKKEFVQAGKLGLIIIIFIVFLIVIASVLDRGPKKTDSQPTQLTNVSKVKEIGEETKIHVDNVLFVYVATDKNSGKELNKFLLARDDFGISQSLLSGKIFMIDNDTKAKILDISVLDGLYEVRILDGKNVGQSAWVPEGFVK